jgi:two-component system chemotaxis sensor kinase CheA
LSHQLKPVTAYAGATIMGDGKVALILDVLGIAQSAHVVTEQRERGLSEHEGETTPHGTTRQTMLLMSIGDRQIAMPISLVARLEEISRSSVEKSGRQDVVQYRGQIMPLVHLGKVLAIPSRDDESRPLQVVVYSEGGRSLGLVVDAVADIADAEVTLPQDSLSEELLASVVIQQRVTDLLNLPTIIRRAAPTFFNECASRHQLAV